MSGNSYDNSCPNCENSMNCYTDHKPYDYVCGECIHCGFQYWTKHNQMSLTDLNAMRAMENEDQGFLEGEEDYLFPLKKRPKMQKHLTNGRDMPEIIIHLPTEDSNPDKETVYNYLKELIENDSLDYFVED